MKAIRLFMLIYSVIPMVLMAQNSESQQKPHVTIATIGPVDSGKTALTCAINNILYRAGLTDRQLTFEQIDSAPEERERGISIYPYILEYETEKVRYTHIDCPGDEDYLRRTAKAIKHIDGAIFVISAYRYPWREDNWKSETERVLKIAKKAKVKKLIVFLNKADLADYKYIETSVPDVRTLIEKYGYSKETPIIKGSALGADVGIEIWEKGVKNLLDTCDEWFTK